MEIIDIVWILSFIAIGLFFILMVMSAIKFVELREKVYQLERKVK